MTNTEKSYRGPVHIQQKFDRFDEHWSPKIVAQMNEVQFKLAKIKGDFVWHSHPDTDELFFVIQGEMRIDLRDRSVTLKAGELFVVPKGVEHKPFAEQECHIMLAEPSGVVNTGEAGGDLTNTAEWI